MALTKEDLQAIGELLKAAEDRLNVRIGSVEQAQAETAENQRRLEGLYRDTNLKITNRTATEFSVHETVNSFSGRFTGLENGQRDIFSRIDNLDSRMDSLDSRMDSFDCRMDGFDKRMDRFEEVIETTHDSQLVAEGKFTDINLQLEYLVANAQADKEREKRVATLERKAEQHDTRLFKLEHRPAVGE